MSDNELDADAELLALAGADSEAEASPSPTPKKARAKGVAQKKTTKGIRRGRKQDSDEEDVPSTPGSLGSGAMSESEDEPIGNGAAKEDDAVLFPVEGKFKSEQERAEIMAMTERDRENLLAERATEVERNKQDAFLRQLALTREARKKAEAEAAKKRKAPVAELDESPRKSTKAKTKATENLEAYKRQREQRNQQRRRNEDRRNGDRESPIRDEEESDRDAEGEEDVEWDEPASRGPAKHEPQAEMKDYERVRVGRTNFARVCFWPGFEDTIKGCFTRVCIGPDKATGQNLYRMCQIKSVQTGRPYTLEGPNGRPVLTNQYAVVAQGKQEKEWPFSACSDSKFSDREFDRYKTQLQQDNMRLPTLSFLQARLTAIHELLDRKWTDEDINERLRRANAVQSAVSERDRLQRERKTAEANYDEAAIARIDAQLSALENRLPAPKAAPPKAMTQQEKLAARNIANRKANRDEIRKAQIADRRREQQLADAVSKGEANANRFARMKTVVRTQFNADDRAPSKPEGEVDAELDDLFGAAGEESAAELTDAAPTKTEAAVPPPTVKAGLGVGGLKKKKADDDLMAAMDLGIEIDI